VQREGTQGRAHRAGAARRGCCAEAAAGTQTSLPGRTEPERGGQKASSTFRFFGCCRSSMKCFLCSSRSRRLLYSSWFSSSVWCCSRIRSIRSFCSVCSCLYSSSRVDSSCRISIACSISFWVRFLFNSCTRGQQSARQQLRSGSICPETQ